MRVIGPFDTLKPILVLASISKITALGKCCQYAGELIGGAQMCSCVLRTTPLATRSDAQLLLVI